jgi:hypothetical protein
MLARHGSRSLTVDAIAYRWAVSGDSGFVTLVVERETGGQRLLATCTPFAYDARELHRAITPKGVARLVRHASTLGWQPRHLGLPPMRLHDVDDLLFDLPDT